MTTGAGVADLRCAAHPARLAAGDCPSCGRPRCAADATRYAVAGCAVCAVVARRRPPGRAEVLVRAGLAALAVSYPTGWVAQQYVNVHLMSLAWPLVLGLAASWAASTAAGRRDRAARPLVLVAAAVGAVLGTALGFRLFDTPVTPVHPWDEVWGPYVAGLAGVLAWPLLFGAPRRAPGQDAGTNR
jgi:hypothetical protein